jgi:hypothetical protein
MARHRQPLSGTAEQSGRREAIPASTPGQGSAAPQPQRVIIITEFDAGDDLNDPDKPTLRQDRDG